MGRASVIAKGSIAALAVLGLAAGFPAASAGGAPAKSAAVSRPIYTTQAPIALLKDMDSGAILFERGADKRFPPASMAKVMTAYIVLGLIEKGELPRDKMVTVRHDTWAKWNGSNGGSTMFLRSGEKISVDDLLKGLITVSANDAAAALAVGIDGSEDKFVQRMNAMASKLGLKSSHFGTPNGWPDGGVTQVSAADLVTLADRLIRDHPADYARYFSIPRLQHGISPEGKPIVQPNTNPILGRFAGVDGLKTGHTEAAGYCFLGSAKRGGRRLIMVIAGMPSEKARREEATRLMNWGFDQWEGRKLVPAGATIGRIDVDSGRAPTVVARNDLAIRMTVPKGYAGGYRAVLRANAPLAAPVARGARIAELVVTPDGLPPQTMPLLAANDVGTGGWWSRARTGFYRLTGW